MMPCALPRGWYWDRRRWTSLVSASRRTSRPRTPWAGSSARFVPRDWVLVLGRGCVVQGGGLTELTWAPHQGQFGTVYEAHAKNASAGSGRLAGKIIWKEKLEDPVLDSIDLISEISVMMKVCGSSKPAGCHGTHALAFPSSTTPTLSKSSMYTKTTLVLSSSRSLWTAASCSSAS